MQTLLGITLPPEATIEEQVEEHIKNPLAVVTCPHCKNEYFYRVEKEFISEFGMCLGCDKLLCDVRQTEVEI